MSSIRKIVSIPAKWAAKSLLRGWLLKFPAGEEQSPVACVYCPEMCRFSCPTAVVTGNDAVTPANKMGLLALDSQWNGALRAQAAGGELWPIYDCTGCGRCTQYCVYDMPVAERLFEARQEYPLKRVEMLRGELDDSESRDPWGDLSEEWGLIDTARKQAAAQAARHLGTHDLRPWIEPKSWEWLERSGWVGELRPAWVGNGRLKPGAMDQLRSHRVQDWLFHESVWHSRRLEQWERVAQWISILREAGVSIRRPFAQGMDCIDCGGEGAYARMFPEQARAMAEEIWERDRHRVQGVITVSSRCAEHFGNLGIPVVGLEEIFEWNFELNKTK